MGRKVEKSRQEGTGHLAQREMHMERWTSGQMRHVLTRVGETQPEGCPEETAEQGKDDRSVP